MKVKANVAFEYKGKAIEQGQTLDVPKAEALELIRSGVAFAQDHTDTFDPIAEGLEKARKK